MWSAHFLGEQNGVVNALDNGNGLNFLSCCFNPAGKVPLPSLKVMLSGIDGRGGQHVLVVGVEEGIDAAAVTFFVCWVLCLI